MKNSSVEGLLLPKVLVIGGAGFLGSFVVAELFEKYSVSVLERQDCNLYRINNFLDQIEVIYTNNLNLNQLLRENPFEFIINCSVLYGYNESLPELIDNNVVFPLKVIEACSGNVKAFISTDTFFNKPENYSYSYLRNYILSKKILEECLQQVDHSIKVINLKLEHLYGPYDNLNKFIPSILSRIKAQEKVIDLTEGNQVRDFIYVKDAAAAYRVIMENIEKMNEGFTGISVGTGQATTIHELVSMMKAILNSSTVLNFGALPYRENEIMHSTGDPAFLNNLGWNIKYNLEEGIRETLPGIK